MLEVILFITVVLIILMSLYIIVKYFISNDKISHLLSQKVVTKENKTYIIKVDYEYQLLTFTWRGIDKDKKPSIISKEYTFNNFIESLPVDQQIYFHEFLFKDCMDDNKKAKITINVNKIFEEKDNNWLRISYLERHANNVVYVKGVKVYKRNINRDKKFEYLTLDLFKNKLKTLYPSVDGAVGSLFYFSFNSIEFYKKRYGDEVANDYLIQMWDELNTIFNNRGFVGHIKDDQFIAYYDKKIVKREIQYFIHSFINTNSFEFGIDNLIRTNKPLIGVIVYGEFAREFDTHLNCLYQTMQKLEDSNVNLHYLIYDNDLYKELKRDEDNLNDLRESMENQFFDPLYSPIITLNSGDTYGFFTDLDFSNYKFRNINDLINRSSGNKLGNTFFSKAVAKWFSSFLNNANMDVQKLFVFTDFDLIDSLINTYTSDEDYDRINLVAVITDYMDILKDPDLTRRKINDLKRNGIQLGIMACPELQSVLSQELHQFTYLVIPRQLTKDIITNPRTSLVLQTIFDMTHDYYMDKIAVDIDNYQEAEVLKEMDVFYMSGNLFDAKKSNISMRRLAHLYDENN